MARASKLRRVCEMRARSWGEARLLARDEKMLREAERARLPPR